MKLRKLFCDTLLFIFTCFMQWPIETCEYSQFEFESCYSQGSTHSSTYIAYPVSGQWLTHDLMRVFEMDQLFL